MASRSTKGRERVTRGSGNVFADLGFPDAIDRQAKLQLAYALNQVLDGRKLSQADAAKVLGVYVGGLFRRTPDEPVDGARPGCRDRDSAKAAVKEISKNQFVQRNIQIVAVATLSDQCPLN